MHALLASMNGCSTLQPFLFAQTNPSTTCTACESSFDSAYSFARRYLSLSAPRLLAMTTCAKRLQILDVVRSAFFLRHLVVAMRVALRDSNSATARLADIQVPQKDLLAQPFPCTAVVTSTRRTPAPAVVLLRRLLFTRPKTELLRCGWHRHALSSAASNTSDSRMTFSETP